jgi:hypothetical protein
MRKQAVEQPIENATAAAAMMPELFAAIGFEVADERSYDLLVESVETNGEWTESQRGEAALHGRCWQLGDGLEVWCLLYQRNADFYYADCRPAFRSRYVHIIERWELVEYQEDGEATVRGVVRGAPEINFELQNLTELHDSVFRQSRLHVALAGIAYAARVDAEPSYGLKLAQQVERPTEELCDNNYEVAGRVIALRDIRNPVTSAELVWIYMDAGVIRLEVVASRQTVGAGLDVGKGITASIWLQGHVLEERDLFARYEGVDREFAPADFWAGLQRGN